MTRRLKTKARDEQRLRVWKANPRCAECGGVVAFEAMELDHVVPLCDGGRTDDDNTAAMHSECHRSKTNREISARASRGAGSDI